MTTPRPSKKLHYLGGAVALAMAAAAVVMVVRRRPGKHPPPAAPAQAKNAALAALERLPWQADVVPDFSQPLPQAAPDQVAGEPGYVGAAACTPCHAKLAKSYASHSMAKTGLRPITVNSAEMLHRAFDAGAVIVQKSSGLSYRPYREGERYFVEERAEAPDGARLHSQVKEITLSLSAGSYGLAFAFQQGSRVWQVPVDYNPKLGHWRLDPGYLESNPRFSRPISGICISCHSDHPRRRAGTLEFFEGPLPLGIGCERCHGPGARHAETGAVADIVNPARLPPVRQLDVCAQCHLEGRSSERPGRSVFSFRPGEPLHAFRMYYVEDPAPPDEFRLLSHSERLVHSPCYQGAADKMTCTTCHNPHRSSLEETPAHWDDKCQGCHTKQACTGDPAERAKVNDHCVGCHMRRSTPADVTQLEMTDHWIQRRPAPPAPPDAPTQRERGYQPKGIIAYGKLVGDQATGEDLTAIEGVANAEFSFFARGVELLVDGMKTWPNVPKAYILLAEAFEAGKQPWNAARVYGALLAQDPNNRVALLGYSRVLLDSGPPASHLEALAALDRLIAIAPDDSDALERKGISLFKSGQLEQARPLLLAAVAASPVAGRAAVALAADALRRGDALAALPHLEEARRIEPWDSWVLEKLQSSYGKLQRLAERAEIEAVLAKAASRQLRPRASAWLPEEWR